MVEEKDAQAAIDLMNYVIREIMTDKESDIISADIIATGTTPKEREIAAEILDIVKVLSEKFGGPVERNLVIKEAVSHGFDEFKVNKVISSLLKMGELYEPRPGLIAFTSSEY